MSNATCWFQGIRQVALFDSGYNLYGVPNIDLAFQSASYGPLMVADAQLNTTASIQGQMIYAQAYMPRVGGTPAALTTGTTPGTGGSQPCWFDDALWFVNYNSNQWCSKFFKDQPGVYNGANNWNYLPAINTLGTYISETYPCLYRGSNSRIVLYAETGQNLGGAIYTGFNYQDNHVFDQIFGLATDGEDLVNNRVLIPNPLYPEYDNCYFHTYNELYDVACARTLWSSYPGFANITTGLNLSDASLDPYFQTLVSDVQVWQGGFIFILNTSGNGPTKQLCEVVVTDCTMSNYYLIKFIPQDTDSSSLLMANNGWNVCIDNQGILWFTNGNIATEDQYRLSYSYSPNQYPFNIIYPGNLNPFDLPCFNTCSNVNFLNT